ncbi:hypothetical protein [Sulfuritalea hydrogenivorans]|uniref:Regulatory protein, RpfE type n=1 Tax=Sulfuritalea hydrogenivorans sk43H TaxID=1223802 RepID=W0SG72_9PROT|nr:hypothetical protein [Sulfuritalea hydrogenivorans]MDK9712649.1 hypothetical protein [Sulfuritalea sp.]BAO29932.1 hypothetical protein SUTH_02142 [Sulfuritalea hydrogenivorans sk43H]
MLTLIVPGLIWTRQALADLTCDLPLPAFATLLGRGRLTRRPPHGTAATLAELSGLRAPLPAAALRRLALRQHPGESDWLCLDPVRLRFHERHLIVDDPRQLDLGDDEAAALAVSLAPTFAALGQLEVLAAGSWNLRLSAGAPDFQALSEAAGRAAAPLPLTPAYAAWRQAINEAQMVLHDHPVNRAREAAGRPLVNSLWPWGGGALPQSGNSPHDAIWSDDPVAQGIARLLQVDCGELPVGFCRTTARAPLAVFDALEQPARVGDALVWRDQLTRFESAWLAPALDALRNGQLDSLRLVAPGELAAAELRVSRGDLWKFWRKPGALTDLAAA